MYSKLWKINALIEIIQIKKHINKINAYDWCLKYIYRKETV